ncbi:MAG TPA: hypothetical protein VJ838_09735, partial [Gaiellaceae bacterium]|nr:hypothetical protein [Gaiellaceae bacterium]
MVDDDHANAAGLASMFGVEVEFCVAGGHRALKLSRGSVNKTSARSWHDDASMGTPPSDEALAREAILAAGTSLAADHIAVEAAAALR